MTEEIVNQNKPDIWYLHVPKKEGEGFHQLTAFYRNTGAFFPVSQYATTQIANQFGSESLNKMSEFFS